MENEKPVSGSIDPLDYSEVISVDGLPADSQRIYDFLAGTVIGQERAARKVSRSLMVHDSGIRLDGRPIGSFLFSGPTGWGKTFFAQQLARVLIKNQAKAPLTHIQCGKSRESHRVSEIVGAPPGYLGFDKTPKLDQFKIDEPHFWVKCRPFLGKALKKAKNQKERNEILLDVYEQNKPYRSVILFDEVEKAHPDIWNALLHIIDDGALELGNGSTTSFAESVIILTCNVGGREQQDILSGGRGMGFSSAAERHPDSEASDDELEAKDRRILEKTRQLIEEKFPPELLGRLNENIVIFRTLTRAQQGTILGNMLSEIQERFSGKADADGKASKVPPALIGFSDRFREFVLDEGVDRKRGMRRLKAAVQRLAMAPLAAALGHGRIHAGDELLLDVQDGKTVIRCRERPAAATLPPPLLIGSGEKK